MPIHSSATSIGGTVTVVGGIAVALVATVALTGSTLVQAVAGQTAPNQVAAGQVAAGQVAPDRLAEAAAPPGGAVTVATVNGSGCPAGTASVATAADGSSFTVTYSAFRAEGDDTGTEFRRNCQISVQVSHPANLTFAITGADHRGTGHLAAGASGEQLTTYYVQGSSASTPVSHAFTGPFDGGWQTSDVIDPAALRYAPCGEDRNLNLNTELRVDAGTATGSNWLAMRSTLTGSYRLTWRSCG